MQRLALLTVGRIKEAWARAACEEYQKRIQGQMQLEIVELMPSKGRTPDQQCAEESERLLRYIERAEGQVYILDETGDRLTSPQFSEMITKARDAGTPMVFVLGGAYGFTDVVRKAGKTLRLSDMTLPHELCRVLFLEQLYRAGEIARGSQYHHA